MISVRHAPLLGVLVAAALVPTIIHGYLGVTGDDGLSTNSIPMVLEGYQGNETARERTWGQRRFESFDWIEREYVTAGDDLMLTVVRSYDLKSVYHHPELAVAYGVPFVRHDVVRVSQRPDVPVHVLRTDVGRPALGVYALHYDGRYIDDPIRFQLRTSLELLISARKPMTLFFVLDADAPPDADPGAVGATRLLFGALDTFAGRPQVGSR